MKVFFDPVPLLQQFLRHLVGIRETKVSVGKDLGNVEVLGPQAAPPGWITRGVEYSSQGIKFVTRGEVARETSLDPVDEGFQRDIGGVKHGFGYGVALGSHAVSQPTNKLTSLVDQAEVGCHAGLELWVHQVIDLVGIGRMVVQFHLSGAPLDVQKVFAGPIVRALENTDRLIRVGVL